MNLIRTAAQQVETLILEIAVVLAVTLLIAHLQHLTFLAVQTNSMQPTFRAGDMVLVRETSAAGQLGTVVAFHSAIRSADIITHRVVAVDRAHHMIQTQGDRLKTPDTPILQTRVIGKVELVVQSAGVLSDFFHRPLGLALGLLLPLCVIIVAELFRLADQMSGRGYRLLRSN